MTRNSWMESPKIIGDCSYGTLDRNVSSVSDIAASSLRKKPLSMKKLRSDVSQYLSPKDMHRFQIVEQKKRYITYKNRSFIPGRVTNLGQPKDSHFSVSNFLNT